MKRTITIVLALCCIIVTSCSGPNSVAEKALKLVGRGTFVPSIADRYMGNEATSTFGLFTDYDKIFSSALIHTDEAKYFLKYGVYKKTPRLAFFDFSDIMFSRFSLISKDEISYDVRDITDYSMYKGLTEEAIQRLKNACRHRYTEYQETGSIGTWLVAKNVPAYLFRYNIENKHVIAITVLKLPDKGYRVCSFMVE